MTPVLSSPNASDAGDPALDLRGLKREVSRLLPPGHPVREGLAREPDFLPLAEGVGKLETYLRLLFAFRDAKP